ncbi:hypothetical protein CesoFtcFv8_008997 [Champsocephalus esox]|uniref:Uncharacterized protein n=1 Tax=Champsocephalus esox TaxID=159716 RepID=A0AAN8H1X4_9TELE|nr:hypothetical protein CesoFtcFv8_008997 [Champsocephalus esox]
MSNDTSHGNPCEAVSTSEAAVSLLLSPLSLSSWLSSTLLRLVLSVPALVLSSLSHSSWPGLGAWRPSVSLCC